MPFDPTAKNVVVAVIGTGTMGRGIMQVSAQGGMHVVAYDEKPGAAQAAKDYIAKMLGSLVDKGRLDAGEAKATVDRISIAPDLAAVAKANIIVEAIIEKLDIKQDLFGKLDALCGPDTILATNTSSLLVTAIAAKCVRHPERVGCMHFFNPVPLMKLVEVVPGLKTAPWVTDAMMTIGRRMTREPVLCKDSPGFIVNHAGRGIREVERILLENIASISEIDRIMTGAPGLKLGPFALFDMVGIDISHGVHESFFAQYYAEPAFQPSTNGTLRVASGLLGAKSGEGWYKHADGKRIDPPLPPAPVARPKSVWVHPSDSHADLQAPLIDIFAKSGVTVETGARPSAEALIVITPIGYDLTTAIAEVKGLDAPRTVAVDVLFGMKGPRTLMVTPATDPVFRDAAHGLLASDGQPVVVINDSPGFVSQRVVAMIVNTCCGIAQRDVATPADIDRAVVLGLGYPYGPLAWGDRIGAKRISFILERLQAFYGEPRYRPTPWLKRRAQLGLPLSAPEGRMR
jgi:3-hydroxybutyryl-CoA dehydrogenase